MPFTARTATSKLRFKIILRKHVLDVVASRRWQSNLKLVEAETMELFISIAVVNHNLESAAVGKV